MLSEPRGRSILSTSPDFAAIATQILDKSFSTSRLTGTTPVQDHQDPSGAGNERERKLMDISSPTITVAASKQNMASVAARIAAIEQSDREQSDRCTAAPPNRQVI